MTFFSFIKAKFSSLFSNQHTVLVAFATITLVASLTVIGVIVIKEITLSKKDMDSNSETYIEITTVDKTTTEEMTTEIDTTIKETTTEEATTEPETTTVIMPETIALEDLNIGEDKEEFDPKQHAAEQNTEPTTTASIEKKPTTPVTTPAVNEVTKVVKGIDVSKWQGDIDWAKVKASGIDFAIIKVAGRSTGKDGALYIDSKFEQNINGALSNGVQVGVYFFSQAITVQEAREEASLMLEAIKGYKFTYPVVFDWETSGDYRTEYAYLSKTQMNAIASTFCDIIKAAGYTPMVYASQSDLMSRYNTEEITSKYKCWVANCFSKYKYTGVQYKAGDVLPSFNYPFQMWQYSHTGYVDGIGSKYVDLNVAFFTFDGTEVPITPVKLNIKNSTINTLLGTSVNLLDGITASNSAGLDVSSAVTYKLTDINRNPVPFDTAISTAGSYTIIYTIKDFTGVSKTATATLVVRTAPTLSIAKNELDFLEEQINVLTLISTVLPENITSALSYESEDILSSLVISYDKTLDNIVKNNLKIEVGTYTITYTITDKIGISNSETVTLVITKEPETTSSEVMTTTSENATSETTN